MSKDADAIKAALEKVIVASNEVGKHWCYEQEGFSTPESKDDWEIKLMEAKAELYDLLDI